jgi:hypothetical protein
MSNITTIPKPAISPLPPILPDTKVLPPILPETKALQEQVKQETPQQNSLSTDHSYIYKYVISACLIIICLLLIWMYFRYYRHIEPVVQAGTDITPPIGTAKIQIVTVPNA